MFIRDKKRTEEDKTRNVGTPERKLFTASSSLLPERKLHVLSLSLIKHKRYRRDRICQLVTGTATI